LEPEEEGDESEADRWAREAAEAEQAELEMEMDMEIAKELLFEESYSSRAGRTTYRTGLKLESGYVDSGGMGMDVDVEMNMGMGVGMHEGLPRCNDMDAEVDWAAFDAMDVE